MPATPGLAVLGKNVLVLPIHDFSPAGTDDAVRAYLARIAPAYAARTRQGLASDWACFTRWCTENARTPFPASPATVISYLEAMSNVHSIATLRRRLASLSHLHDALTVTNPTHEPQVRLLLRGLARVLGSRPQHRRAPLRQDDVEKMIAILGESLWDLRDKAMLLTARDSLARRSELARLAVADLDFREGSGDARIVLRRTKAESDGRSAWLAPGTCEALGAWLVRARISEGHVFRRIDNAGRIGTSFHPQSIARRFKKMARAAGLEATKISGHSTRIGTCIDLVADGQSLVAIQLTGGWASPAQPALYAADLLPELGAVARYYRSRAALLGPT